MQELTAPSLSEAEDGKKRSVIENLGIVIGWGTNLGKTSKFPGNSGQNNGCKKLELQTLYRER